MLIHAYIIMFPAYLVMEDFGFTVLLALILE